jgi:hypothetical protein
MNKAFYLVFRAGFSFHQIVHNFVELNRNQTF